jgi:transcriptional regulator GlxA family with amidase domain
MPRNLAIMLFDDVEVLDFCGPFEVFAVTRDHRDGVTELFNVYTVAETTAPVIARNGLSVNPAYTLESCPPPDIFLIPGGIGTRTAMNNHSLLGWIQQQVARAELALSVCTGGFAAGEGRSARRAGGHDVSHRLRPAGRAGSQHPAVPRRAFRR